MFSGIVEKVARVAAVERDEGGLTLTLDTGLAGRVELGESIAVNGVCLTALEERTDGLLRFYASPETIARSNIGRLAPGGLANVERSVTLETRLSGHLMQGHVDGQAVLTAIIPDGEARRIELDLPVELGRYCVEKGSIALNGISLTLNGVDRHADRCAIWISIIPHTWEHTSLQAAEIGAPLNVEVDVVAKYVESLTRPYLKS